MANQKTIERHVDSRFGFPVEIRNAPLRQSFGDWALDLNANDLRHAVMKTVATSEGKLTGAHVHFIRLALGFSMAELGEKLGVSHAAISKWEMFGQQSTNMNKSNELMLRGYALASLHERDVFELIKDITLESSIPAVVVELFEAPTAH